MSYVKIAMLGSSSSGIFLHLLWQMCGRFLTTVQRTGNIKTINLHIQMFHEHTFR